MKGCLPDRCYNNFLFSIPYKRIFADIMRSRLYIVLAILTVPAGLATRHLPAVFPSFIQTYAGDVLYATMIFFLIRALLPAKPLLHVTAASYTICILIELQQLYRAGWIIELRHTFPFGLILGYDFAWSDCICYAIGCLTGTTIASVIEKK